MKKLLPNASFHTSTVILDPSTVCSYLLAVSTDQLCKVPSRSLAVTSGYCLLTSFVFLLLSSLLLLLLLPSSLVSSCTLFMPLTVLLLQVPHSFT